VDAAAVLLVGVEAGVLEAHPVNASIEPTIAMQRNLFNFFINDAPFKLSVSK